MPLNKNTPVGEWIRDFQNSDDPRFSGDSKEQRRKRAIAAYMKAKNEEYYDGEDVLIEDLVDLDEAVLPPNHPLYRAARNGLSSHLEIHSIKHVGDSSNGTSNLEVRVKRPGNAVRIHKVVVKNGNVIKSNLSGETDIRHLNDSIELIYETADLTKLLNPLTKPKRTTNEKHFINMMMVRRLQHNGNYTVERKGSHEIHYVHGANGKVAVGSWDHSDNSGKYIPPLIHDSVEMEPEDAEVILENIEIMELHEDEMQLDEISNKTKSSYADKAIADIQKNKKLINSPNIHDKFKKYAGDMIQKRMSGLSKIAEAEQALDESEYRGNLSDIHSHIKARVEEYLNTHGGSLEHLNSLAKILDSEVSHDKERKTNQYTIKKK